MSRKKEKGLDLNIGELPEQEPVALAMPVMPTLTLEEMKEIEAQAVSEVDAELKAKLKADFLAKTKSELKKKTMFLGGKDDPGQKIERILVDLPKFSDRIVIDGTIYFHGATYAFAKPKADVVKEIMNRQWLHHAEINGLDMNEYNGRKKANAVLTRSNL